MPLTVRDRAMLARSVGMFERARPMIERVERMMFEPRPQAGCRVLCEVDGVSVSVRWPLPSAVLHRYAEHVAANHGRQGLTQAARALLDDRLDGIEDGDRVAVLDVLRRVLDARLVADARASAVDRG